MKSLRILPCWDVVYDEENPRIYSCRNDLGMVLTQVAMLEKEKAILVSVERRASEEVASLSKCVHRLQVDIFSHVEYVCQFQIFSCWNVSTCKTAEWHVICICVESLCRHGAFNCDIWMECYRLHWIPFRQWKKLMRYINFSCDFFWAWVSGLGWQFEPVSATSEFVLTMFIQSPTTFLNVIVP